MTKESKTLTTPEGYAITFRERESVKLSLNISKDTMELLEKIAEKRDLTVISLMKLFISKGVWDLEPELAKEHSLKKFKSRKVKQENPKIDLAA